LAGENVCIQAITPITESSDPASSIARRIDSESVSTGRQTTSIGMSPDWLSSAATCCDCSATWARVSSPYSP